MDYRGAHKLDNDFILCCSINNAYIGAGAHPPNALQSCLTRFIVTEQV